MKKYASSLIYRAKDSFNFNLLLQPRVKILGVRSRQLCDQSDILEDRKVQPRSSAFYSDENRMRRYYYVVDTRGHLFLESSRVRVFATCLRDPKFLNFFYKQLQRNTIVLEGVDPKAYPFISLCGKEINFVAPEDPVSSVVFTALDASEEHLTYGCGQLKQPFDPSLIRWSKRTHRIYHYLTAHPRLSPGIGLLHPELAQVISEGIDWSVDDTRGRHFLRWKGVTYPLQVLEEDPLVDPTNPIQVQGSVLHA